MPRKSPDPLANLSTRGHIDQAQFLAGREFQRHFGLADKRRPDNLTGEQLTAWKWLGKCYVRLGADGSALVNDVLIHCDDRKTDRGGEG